MSAAALKNAYHDFAQVAGPYLHIKDASHYNETLALIEELLEEAEDSLDDPTNTIIDLLSRSIDAYENENNELVEFKSRVMGQPADLSLLRLLMDQHKLGTADLPEIGSKSMVSRVLSGGRSLNKNHIVALSERFNIDPGLFF
ncbi:Antitoxin HigA [hydrothermal vent metagenome]|uniref:Antitoxin HigA n=1 Tax=hydrothermal vent metagenome TaxID=652676 RepID=A0A3B0Y5R0_9ZZZZ